MEAKALQSAVEASVSVISVVGVAALDARQAYDAYCEALGGAPEEQPWEEMLPVRRRAWRAALYRTTQRASVAEGMVKLLSHERDALAAQVGALREQLGLVERARADEHSAHVTTQQHLANTKGRVLALLEELDGTGGFRQYQRLTTATLQEALTGLPEETADLPHPVWASRAAAALRRFKAEKQPPEGAVVVTDVGFAYAPPGTNATPLMCLNVNRLPDEVAVDWAVRVVGRPSSAAHVSSTFDGDESCDGNPGLFLEWSADFIAQRGDVLEFIAPEQESATEERPETAPTVAM